MMTYREKILNLIEWNSIQNAKEIRKIKTLLIKIAFTLFIVGGVSLISCSQGIKIEERKDDFTKMGFKIIYQNISNGLFYDGRFPKNEFKLYFNEYETEYYSSSEDWTSGICEIIITINYNNTNDIRFQSKHKYDFVNTNEILKCAKPWKYNAQYGGWEAEFRNSKGFIINASMDGMSNIDLNNWHKDYDQSLMLYLFEDFIR
jgi:hypothetical protein